MTVEISLTLLLIIGMLAVFGVLLVATEGF